MEELTGLTSKWASTLMSQHLLAAADRYGLDRLRLMCEANLCEVVAINTVATTLALAEQHHCFRLKAVCLKFVAMPENLRGESFKLEIFEIMDCSPQADKLVTQMPLLNAVKAGLTLEFHGLLQAFVEISDFSTLYTVILYPSFGISVAVMQTDGFEYLKQSCPSVLTELLEYVARVNEHPVIVCRHGNEAILDGSDANGRREIVPVVEGFGVFSVRDVNAVVHLVSICLLCIGNEKLSKIEAPPFLTADDIRARQSSMAGDEISMQLQKEVTHLQQEVTKLQIELSEWDIKLEGRLKDNFVEIRVETHIFWDIVEVIK
ncbi:hypothetical protein Goari_013796 [Gossypium aridum]|uniref:BPM/SPOP BACK domain-containing protein n=1 Tax=Gossypium aridum TaxID=34290 RepID=A0A7J8XFW0_GOSAI|nr:hypothetical protein [Gossypium aridum]